MEEEDDPFLKMMAHGEKIKAGIEHAGRTTEGFFKVVAYNALVVGLIMYLLFVLYFTLAPLLLASANPQVRGMGAIAYISSSVLMMCHQLPQRTFTLASIHQPVCSRDIGLFLGTSAGFIIPLLYEKTAKKTNSIKFFLACLAPLAVDGLSQSIFHLWESNNLTRFITGLIFGLGLAGYATAKFLVRYPDFRSVVLRTESLAAAWLTTLFLAYFMVSGLYYASDLGYLSRQDAVYAALNETGLNEAGARAFYIAPRVPLSIQADPYAQRYDDHVLGDLRGMDWAKKQFNWTLQFLNLSEREKVKDEFTLHRSGIWAVVFAEDRGRGGRYVYSNARGTYVYVDARTGEMIEAIKH